MDDELPIEFASIKDDARPTRTGTVDRSRIYVFYLGDHGPFTERVALPITDDTEIRRRIDALRVQLRGLQRA